MAKEQKIGLFTVMTIIMINLMKGKTLSSSVLNMIMTRPKKAQGQFYLNSYRSMIFGL